MPLYPLYPSKHGGMTISCEMWAAIATNKYVVWKLSVIPDTVFGTCIPTHAGEGQVFLHKDDLECPAPSDPALFSEGHRVCGPTGPSSDKTRVAFVDEAPHGP
jgi:hypothetical protein